MKRMSAGALLLVSFNLTSAGQRDMDVFGEQLQCATRRALNAYSPNISDASRVRRAVDSCIASSVPNQPRVVQTSGKTTLVTIEARREDLVDATIRRLQLCRDAGIASKNFSVACPRLFTLED